MKKLLLTYVMIFLTSSLFAQFVEIVNPHIIQNSPPPGFFGWYVGFSCQARTFEIDFTNEDFKKNTEYTIVIKPSGVLNSQNFFALNVIGAGYGFQSVSGVDRVIYKNIVAKDDKPIRLSFGLDSKTFATIKSFLDIYVYPKGQFDPVAAQQTSYKIYQMATNGSLTEKSVGILHTISETLANTSISQALANNLLLNPSIKHLSQLKVIEGDLIVDTDYTFRGEFFAGIGGFSNSLLHMKFNSRIVVKSGKTLTLNNTTLIGCDNLWRSIYVEPGGRLLMNTCQVYDATYGVHSTAGSTVNVTSSYFEDNVIGVYQESNSTNVGVVGTTFRGKSVLKSDDLKPLAGIRAESNAIVSCFESNFTNMYKGIDGYNAIINSNNCTFSKIIKFLDDKGDGSAIFNDDGGFTDSRSDVFDKMDINGVETYSGDLVMEDAVISNAKKVGIKTDFVSTMTLVNVNVSSSDMGIRADLPIGALNFVAGSIKAKTNGIFLNTMITAGSSKIEKFDVISASNTGKSIGINVSNPWGNGLLIENNKYIESQKGKNAIYLGNPYNVKVSYNTIFSGESVSSVRSENGTKLFFGCNIIGGGQTPTNLDVSMSEGAYVCNTMSGTALGTAFDGGNGMTRFAGNDMSNGVGLKLNKTAFIGIQRHKGNKWQNSAAICENPAIQNSRFFVTTDPTCDGVSEYMPSNVSPQLWFSNECPEPGEDTYDCSSNCKQGIGPHKIGNWHGDVLVHGFPDSKFDKELTWITRKQIYQVIKEDSSVLNSAPPFFHDFETQVDNEAIGKLYEVEVGMRNLNRFGVEISQQETELVAEISEKLKICTALDKQIKLTREEDVLASLYTQRLQVTSEIASIKTSLDQLRAQMSAIRLSRIDALIQLNQQVEASNNMEYNERTVNDFVLTQMIKPRFKPTDEMLTDIAHIALQCPITGGGAVYRARNIYALKYPEETFNDDNCNDGILNKLVRNTNDISFKVSPNPSNDYFNIEIKVKDAENTKLELFDLLGRSMWKSTGLIDGYNAIFVETFGMPEGIYTLVQSHDGNVIDKIKVVVNKN